MNWLVLIGSVWLGGLLGLTADFIRQTIWPKIFLSFGGAYLLGVSFLVLLPMVYQGSAATVGVWVLVGFLIQIFLEYFSQGIEHGHMHLHEHGKGSIIVSVMFGLCVHAYLEGFPLDYLSHGHEHEHLLGSSYLWGLAFHKFPAAFALVTICKGHHLKRQTILICLTIFSLMSPLGYLTGGMLDVAPYLPQINALVVGLFLHIATTILFEMSPSHRAISLYRLIAILAGFVLVYLTQ
ncbi:MAG: ZIP family metal transporter [Saprospiraceae bacterium]|nr:ZIP family metal transporter [Saprospiraceae bacterium]MCB9318763.1 ZIP family metal transporter [Lewinellaceae bacterium]